MGRMMHDDEKPDMDTPALGTIILLLSRLSGLGETRLVLWENKRQFDRGWLEMRSSQGRNQRNIKERIDGS